MAKDESIVLLCTGDSTAQGLSPESVVDAEPPRSQVQDNKDNIFNTFGLDLYGRGTPAWAGFLTTLTPLDHGSLGVVEEVHTGNSSCKSFVRKRVGLLYSNRKQRVEIIKAECKAVQELGNAHTVRSIAFYEERSSNGREHYTILMFLVGQDNLKDVLDYIGEKLRNPETGDVVSTEYRWIQERFACLSSGLAYIHEQGVLHQDIKPSNIIHRDDRVYFTDFSSYSRFTLGQTTSTESPARTSLMHGAPEVVHSVLADGSLQRH